MLSLHRNIERETNNFLESKSFTVYFTADDKALGHIAIKHKYNIPNYGFFDTIKRLADLLSEKHNLFIRLLGDNNNNTIYLIYTINNSDKLDHLLRLEQYINSAPTVYAKMLYEVEQKPFIDGYFL